MSKLFIREEPDHESYICFQPDDLHATRYVAMVINSERAEQVVLQYNIMEQLTNDIQQFLEKKYPGDDKKGVDKDGNQT